MKLLLSAIIHEPTSFRQRRSTHARRRTTLGPGLLCGALLLTGCGLCCLPSTCTCDAVGPVSLPLPNTLAGLTISYALYSILVDRYAAHTLDRMRAVETLIGGIDDPLALELALVDRDADADGAASATPARLRTTISKRTNLVTNSDHRKSWHRWKITQATVTTNNNNRKTQTQTLLEPGRNYTFVYRNKADTEESNEISASLRNWRFFGPLVHAATPGRLIVHHNNNDGDDDGKRKRKHENNNNNSCRVTLEEEFVSYRIIPVRIAWHGTFTPTTTAGKGKDKQRCGHIVWDRTEVKYGSKRVENPPIAQKLSSVPWDLVKCEDGMVCFEKADSSGYYIVYDKIK